MCENTQYDKHGKKTNIGLFKFPDREKKPQLYKVWFNKTKIFAGLAGKISFEIQMTQFHFKITDINVSTGRHRKTVNPLAFTFEKKS